MHVGSRREGRRACQGLGHVVIGTVDIVVFLKEGVSVQRLVGAGADTGSMWIQRTLVKTLHSQFNTCC